MQINGLFIFLHLYFTYVYPESDIECSIKLLLIKGGGGGYRSTDPRSQSKFADRVLGELIPQMQALNLLENKIIRST